MKATKDFMSGYKTYDVEEQGYGNTYEWKRTFYQRMSKEEAQEILNEDSPYTILGIKQTASQEEIKAAYRRLAIKWHPDHNLGNEEYCKVMFQKINAAYCLLK
jgi:DnaJ-class molecular chaperone